MTATFAEVNPRDIGFVVQGYVDLSSRAAIGESLAALRRLAPEAQIILSTWEACAEAAAGLDADIVVTSKDPGALHGIRISGETENNVNRQIVSTAAGLAQCDRPYVVKLRTDESLRSLGFLDLYRDFLGARDDRIVVGSLFTLDPFMFEQVPMHISDWFQFGSLAAVRAYWDCPFMTTEEAVWYGTHRYAAHSTHLDRRFFCKFAVEQHLAIHYAARFGLALPRFHNDIAAGVMAAHRQLLARHFIVGTPDQLGLEFPKYDWAIRSDFQKLNCVDHLDWLALAAADNGPQLTAKQRAGIGTQCRRKSLARTLYRLARPAWPLLTSPQVKTGVNLVLRVLTGRGQTGRQQEKTGGRTIARSRQSAD